MASGSCGDNLTWNLDETTGVLTISGTGQMNNYSSSSTADFRAYKSQITEVVIESGITSIGNVAFRQCSALTSVTIPDSVTSIGDSAFYQCFALTSINIPDSVTSIGYMAFAICSALKSVTIGNGVTSIGKYVFSNCSALTKITFLGEQPTLGSSAFNLGNVTATIYSNGWASDDVFTTAIKGGYTTFVYRLGGACGDDAQWEFNNGVLRIYGTGAMYDYEYGTAPWNEYLDDITSVVVEDGITVIGEYAFDSCENMTSATMGNSVTTIKDYAFRYCYAMESITLSNGLTTIADFVFYKSDGLKSVVIPASVTSIGMFAFNGCESLTEITFEGVQPTLGNSSFALGDSSKVVKATVLTNGGWGSDAVFTEAVKGQYTTFNYGFSAVAHVNENGVWVDHVWVVNINGVLTECESIKFYDNAWKETE